MVMELYRCDKCSELYTTHSIAAECESTHQHGLDKAALLERARKALEKNVVTEAILNFENDVLNIEELRFADGLIIKLSGHMGQAWLRCFMPALDRKEEG
jgi:hypothetical protein